MAMIWQRSDQTTHSRYHLLAGQNGNHVKTACGMEVYTRRGQQTEEVWAIYDRMCPTCKQIWQIVFTSVDEARSTLKSVTDLPVLEGALRLARQKNGAATLIKMLERRVQQAGRRG
jgi:hypothetical protein